MIIWRKLTAAALMACVCLLGVTATAAAKPGDHPKLDRKLNDRAAIGGSGTSRVIVTLNPGADASGDYRKTSAKVGLHLGIINSDVVSLPNALLRKLADSPAVASMHWDRPTSGEMNRAAVTVGARAVQQQMGFDGAGVGVAVIDSGITNWHDDLTYAGSNPAVKVVSGQRVTKFVDFVNGHTTAYDDNGHGTHVAGIIAGNGYDSLGARAGIAPAADVVSLKVLDAHAGGYTSTVIAALGWVVTNRLTYNIRVVNLSVGAPVTESYKTDPLTLAAKLVVDQGVVLVTAAGNLGKNRTTAAIQYGAITAPGNAPWVLTVGAYNHMGTVTRTDDVMTDYSSRGPTALDYAAKPDVVAPGTGIVSLSVPGSYLFTQDAAYLVSGLYSPASKPPYLSLSGTSMAAPIVAGTVALMMQANPKLTPNLAKAIIEYTAQDYGYNALTQGAGFLNTQGAVQLARYLYTATPGSAYPTNAYWSHTILWGNRKITNGAIKPQGSAYALNVVWGSINDAVGRAVVWGTECANAACDNIVWGTSVLDADNIVWGTFDTQEGDNIVWGTECGNATCDNIVWGTECGDATCDNIVWGTECGLLDCDNIVWGTECGTVDCDNIVWGTNVELDNIVWGTSLDGEVDNIVWGTSSELDNIVWGTSADQTVLFDDPVSDALSFDSLFGPDPVEATTVTTTTTSTVIGGTF